MMTVADKVKELRIKQELNLRQLAEKTGVSVSTISRIENDHDNVRFSKIIDVFYGLGYTLTLKLKERE